MEFKKDMSMETRLLLAFLLMGLVLFGTQYFYKPPPAPAAAKTTPAKIAEPARTSEAATVPEPPTPAKTVPVAMPGQIQADKEETFTVDTDLYRVTFSNRGAVVRSWILKTFTDDNKKPLDLVNQAALAKVPAPFSLEFKAQPAIPDESGALYKVEQSPDKLRLAFEYSDVRADIKKSFQFSQDKYLVNVTTQVTQNGVLVPHSIAWRGGFGDETVPTAATDQHSVYYDLANSKLVRKRRESRQERSGDRLRAVVLRGS